MSVPTPRAAMDVVVDVLGNIMQTLNECGVVVVGSLKSDREGTVRLLIESDLLPDACLVEEYQVVMVAREERSPGRRSIIIEQFALVS